MLERQSSNSISGQPQNGSAVAAPLQPALDGLYTQSLDANHTIQYKLSVGAVDDPMEAEADAMADKVMRMPEQNFIQRKCSHCEEEEARRKPLASFIQRKATEATTTVTNAVNNQIQATRGGGHHMPANTKTFMESRFGTDFSSVRIHSGTYASQLANDLNAQAFTVGNDIYFNNGKFSPESYHGRHLLAHELTHTIQQEHAGSANNSISRKEGDIVETKLAPGNITVKRTIVPGECKLTKDSSSSLDGGFRNKKLFFEAKACKNNTTGEAYGDLDFGDFVDGAGKFAKSLGSNILSGNPTGKLTEELNKDFKDEKLKASLRLVLRVGNFRAELKGTGGVSESKNGNAGVSSFIRYTNGEFRIELGGEFNEVWQEGQKHGEGTYHLYTDAGPIVIRIDGKQGPSGASVEGTIGDRDISKNTGLKVSYTNVGGQQGVVFSLVFQLPEKIQQESAPDCMFCGCETPRTIFECTEPPHKSPPVKPQSDPQYIPLYYNYALTTPRSDKDFPPDEYNKTINRIIGYIQNGYTIDHIEGYTSPEGKLEGKAGRFEGNKNLSVARANQAAQDIKAAITRSLESAIPSIQIDLAKVKANLAAAGSGTITTIGENELHGSDQQSADIPESKLYAHLSKDLKTPGEGEEDVLEKERIIGESLPEALRDQAAADINSFRTGIKNKRKLTETQRLQLLYPWLRKALVILQPPPPEMAKIDLFHAIPDVSNIIPCSPEQQHLFDDTPVPEQSKLFIDHCTTKLKPK